MALGRVYTISENATAVTAAVDLLELLGSADSILRLRELHVTQSSDAGDSESEQLLVSIRRVTGAPTSGSGGSTPTPAPLNPGDAAFGGTTETVNTTQLSGGTNTVLSVEAFNVMAGLHYMPPEDSMPRFAGATRLLVELEAAPADSVTVSFYAVVEEID